MCSVWRVVVAGSENRKSLYLLLNFRDAVGCSYWEVGVRATEGGMLSCFNLCQCHSVGRWWEFRAQCVPLYVAVDPAGWSCRRPSKASALYISVWLWGLINVVVIPFCPIRVAPLKGRLAEQPPLHCCSPCKQRVQLLVILPVFLWCESRCSLKDLFYLFPSP